MTILLPHPSGHSPGMIPFALACTRWLVRLLTLALSVILCAGFVASTPSFEKAYGGLVVGALVGFGGWWCAVYGPPECADGQAPGSDR